MTKLVLNNTTNANTLSVINANFQKIVDELENNVLYRNNPLEAPNSMLNDLDMNDRRIFNLPAPVSMNEPARLQDIIESVKGYQTATTVPFDPYGSISSVNVQGAIQELADDIANSGYTPEGVSVKSFGALGNGVNDDTSAVQAAMNSGAPYIIFPKGDYRVGRINVPVSVKKIAGVGAGASNVTCINTFANYTPWFHWEGASGMDIGGLTFNQDQTVYGLNTCLSFGSSSFVTIHDIVINDCGFAGVALAGCSNVLITNVTVVSFFNSAILSEINSTRIRIIGNIILGRSTGHSIYLAGGGNNEVSGNFVNGAGPGTFSISILTNDTIVSNNKIIANLLEGINVQDASRVSVVNNTVYCENTHKDFAISVYAAVAPVEGCIITGNKVFFAGSSGIGIASTNGASAFCRYNVVSNNLVMNCNRMQSSMPVNGRGGIVVYGPKTSANTIKNNTVMDEENFTIYGVAEWDDSLGPPSYNYLVDNTARGGAALIETHHKIGTGTLVWDLDIMRTTTFMSASTGILNAATSSLAYQRRGKLAHVVFGATVSNNGSGSGTLQSSLPFQSVAGILSGRESTSGRMIQGRAAGSTLLINLFDNNYPVVSGTYVELSGTFEIA